MRLANPRLSELITSRIGDGWLRDLEQLAQLEPYADDPQFRQAWRKVKHQNKQDLAALMRQLTGMEVDPASLFDVMVKRLHEYKRQLLKTLHIVALYQRVLADPNADIVPRTFVFGAKTYRIVQQLKLAGDERTALLLLDRELAQRMPAAAPAPAAGAAPALGP